MNKKVYLWTGDGWGKTTSALGAALRALGHEKKVIMIQFMKGRKDIGEYKMAKKLRPNFEFYQFGRPNWVNLKNPSKTDQQLAQAGFEFAQKKIKEKPFLLILDEINLAAEIGLVSTKEIIKFLNQAPANVHIYLTGRRAPKALLKRANWVNMIVPTKGSKKLKGEKGIDL